MYSWFTTLLLYSNVPFSYIRFREFDIFAIQQNNCKLYIEIWDKYTSVCITSAHTISIHPHKSSLKKKQKQLINLFT